MKCVYCGKDLPARKRKYCNELCRFRFLSIESDKPEKFSVAQHLRIIRAGRAQRRSDVRYN